MEQSVYLFIIENIFLNEFDWYQCIMASYLTYGLLPTFTDLLFTYSHIIL
jgi:hypothetical protein